jgi:hypothetical protein
MELVVITVVEGSVEKLWKGVKSTRFHRGYVKFS